uniref:Uncharacterized protein n=1 Tax=Daucus carota subsp. sativus TaxID=79200 RepID=A0A164UZY6_DAUCS
MRSGWRGGIEKLRSLAGGGLDRGSNIASWALAGGVAYYLWVKPSQDLKREHQDRVARTAAAAASADIDKKQKSTP